MKYYHSYRDLIENNKIWVGEKLETDPDYFQKLSVGQKPPFLFIGCSDSRMPLDTFTKTEPGELFIHRNIANQVSPTDMNLLSVLEYAVNVLKVEHIIVCGHYNCGGIEAAYKSSATGLVENWINPIKAVIRKYKNDILSIESEEKKLHKIAELNVIQQVKNLFKTSIIQKAILNEKKFPALHGWVLDIGSGFIKEMEIPMDTWKNEGVVPKPYKS